MNIAVFNRLEIDVAQINEIQEATQFAHKYKLPAMVIHPSIANEAMICRGKSGAKFKLIVAIDWPKGETYGFNKMRGLSTDVLELDGFEILLTPGKNKTETKNEANLITEFVKKHLGDSTEVRFILGVNSRSLENIQEMCTGLLGIRTPAIIRNDIMTKSQVSKANTTEHNRHINIVRNIIRVPYKVSGNITLRSMFEIPADRFAVNLMQAKNICKEHQAEPDLYKEYVAKSNA